VPADSDTPVRVPRTVSGASTNGAGAHDGHHESEALTVTVPLRITVRQGNGSIRAPAVAINVG
jgi:hypothetical protein